MQELTLAELKERIVAQMDPDTLLEYLDIPMDELVELLQDHIENNYDKIARSLDFDE